MGLQTVLEVLINLLLFLVPAGYQLGRSKTLLKGIQSDTKFALGPQQTFLIARIELVA